MGSFLSYIAFSTDMPCSKDEWRKVFVSKDCADCDKCIRNCPIKAISKDNFLLDPGRCLPHYKDAKT